MSSGIANRAPALLTSVVLLGAMVAMWPSSHRARRAAVALEPRSPEELALTLELSSDVWSEADQPVVVVLAPASIDALAARGVPHRIVVDDIDAVADQERTRLRTRDAAAGWFDEYRDLDEITEHMALLAARNPATAIVRTVGASVERRPIREIAISRGGKIGIALDGAQHAREWISAMVPICIADRLLQDGPRVRRILESVSFYIVPVVNPDGYAYTWTDDRYWRKNRRGGYGVDVNRNYSVAWGEGSSTDRRSPNYRGERAFSEPEAQAMRALFATESIQAHIDFHSYSQVLLFPWSHQKAPPPDRDKFAAIADRMGTGARDGHRRHARRLGLRRDRSALVPRRAAPDIEPSGRLRPPTRADRADLRRELRRRARARRFDDLLGDAVTRDVRVGRSERTDERSRAVVGVHDEPAAANVRCRDALADVRRVVALGDRAITDDGRAARD